MAYLSKAWFDSRVAPEMTCVQMFHPWSHSCLHANWGLFAKATVGVTRFFLPVYIVQAIIDRKKLNKKYFFQNFLLGHLRTTCYGLLFAVLILGTNCLASKLIGLHYYAVGLGSGFVAGLSILVETVKNKNLDYVIFANLGVESLLRNMDHFGIIKLTSTNLTLLFMAVSSSLMYLLRTRREKALKFTHLWFYVPPKIDATETSDQSNKHNDNGNLCKHGEVSCSQFALDGYCDNFLLGYALGIARSVIPKLGKVVTNPKILLSTLLSSKNILLGTLLGSYVGIYRYVSCYLLKRDGSDKSAHAPIAGLLAGATFALKNDMQVLIIGIVTLIQTLYTRLKGPLRIPESLPVSQLTFMACNGILLHNRLLIPKTCPSYYKNMLHTCSSGLFDRLYGRMLSVLVSY